MQEITVIGAGVVGLTTALVLQSTNDYKVTLVASAFPHNPQSDPNYTSPKAGAHWRSTADRQDLRQQRNQKITHTKDWDEISFKKFWDLKNDPQTGVMQIKAFDYWKSKPLNYKDPWYAHFIPGFKELDPQDIPEGAGSGVTYDTLSMHTLIYTSWLLSQFISKGGKTIQSSINHIDDAFMIVPNTVLVINCTGLGGVQDPNVYPTRGQLVIINAPQIKHTVTRLDDFIYMIPRADGTVALGGTFEANQSSLLPDGPTSTRIVDAITQLVPELGPKENLQILQESVGLRPTRHGGVRLELESRGSHGSVIHNYGHGGMGYQSSWGCAESVLALAQSVFSKS